MSHRYTSPDALVFDYTNHVFIVAELSANHNGSFEQATEIIRAAKAAGADAVKLQTYTADTITIDCGMPAFRIKGGTQWDGQTLYDLYLSASTPWEWQPELKKVADEIGILLFSSPFDPTAVDFLEKMNVPAYKIASMELVDDELLTSVARTRKPVFLATGMANAEEIAHALEVLTNHDSGEVVLLHCVSAYPAKTSEMNLRTLPDMAVRFARPVGLSDHTLNLTAAVGAAALGARVIEKHLTLDRANGGPDAAFSLNPAEFAELVKAVRFMETALGGVWYGPTQGERASLAFRRSLYAVKDILIGERFTRENVKAIRPGGGLAPRFFKDILNQRTSRNIFRGEPLDWSMLKPF